jgi:UDP-GlcNAc3NAcA epimerase
VKIATIVGARPQFVKASAVSRVLRSRSDVREVLIHTGQHYDRNMSHVFFEEMDIPQPDYDLQVHSLSHGAMTGRMLERIEQVLLSEMPEYVLIYGDTNSTLAGALAAAKLRIPVAHVEAGLRSHNMDMPEEINRIVADRMSRVLFCPTKHAVENLRREGFETFGCKIVRSGDVMQDAALYYAKGSGERSSIIRDLGLDGRGFALCTVHRAENTDDLGRLTAIMEAMVVIHRDQEVVFPVHPRTRSRLTEAGIEPAVHMIDPVGYFDIIELLKHCALVLTDSGGLQKEAFFFGKHCVSMRDETEWVELVEGGYNCIAHTTTDGILKAYHEMLAKESDFGVDIYGRGRAADCIVDTLVAACGEARSRIV